jgi:hypothetical protein
MAEQRRAEVTSLLLDWRGGDAAALERLIPLVYDELRRVARAHLRREPADRTLQTTALVHEVYLRLVDLNELTLHNRTHFFAVAARLMRQILVDHARRKRAGKRGGGVAAVSSIVTTSPTFMASRVQPSRMRKFGLPISIAQLMTWPVSSFTSMCTWMCGFAHSIFVTGPVSVIGFLPSNTAENEWCARADIEARSTKSHMAMMVLRLVAASYFAPAPSMCCTDFSFSLQMYSSKSVLMASNSLIVAVHGFVYAFESSTVIATSRVP